MDPQQTFLTALHVVILVIFGVSLLFAGITVAKLRNTSDTYNARLFTFAYFSLSSWILWVLQYVILTVVQLPSTPSGFSLNTALSLGLLQNALWASGVLSLHLRPLSRKTLTLPVLVMFCIVLVAAFQINLLTSAQFSQYLIPFDAISTATIFIILAVSILQLRLSKISSTAFLIHAYSQWVWGWLWLSPWGSTPIVQFGFPLWRIALLFAWIRLISEMLKRAQPRYLLVTLKVMISSTVEDLLPEREAADRAIGGLRLTRFRAETFGSVPHPPKVVCALLAEQCDIFILIIGQRYGYIMSDGISVVEFEFRVARRQNREKIFVYVKDGMDREPLLEDFLTRVENFDDGYFRSLFTTPDDLHQKIQSDIGRWLVSQLRHIH